MNKRLRDIGKLTIDEIEDIALYAGLILIIVFELVVALAPRLGNIIPKGPVPFYAAMLLVLRIVLKKIGEIKKVVALRQSPTQDFNQQVRRLIKEHARVRQLDFLATNTRKFYHAIEDLEFYADHIRILIYSETPDLASIIARWQCLRQKGICRTLQIRAYHMAPSFYGLVIDKKEGCFGFFDPRCMVNPSTHLATMQITGPYLLSKGNPSDQAMLQDISQWFDELFDHHADSLYDSEQEREIVCGNEETVEKEPNKRFETDTQPRGEC